MLAKLGDLREKVELCDEYGLLLGLFQPVPARDRKLYQDIEVPVSEEELDRIEEDVKSGCKLLSTAEVIAHLKA